MKRWQKLEEQREWTEEELMAAAALVDENLGDPRGYLTIAEAFAKHGSVAAECRLPGYKTEHLFLRALNERGLTRHLTGFRAELVALAKKAGTTPEALWLRLDVSPDQMQEQTEITSAQAVRKLFQFKRGQRRKLDRERKARKSRPIESSEKMTRKSQSKKRIAKAEKRSEKAKKRKR